VGIHFYKDKLLYVDGKLAFSPACCCNVPCNRRVYVLSVSAGSPFYVDPPQPPLRTGNGGRSYIMFDGYAYDTYSSPAGSAYRTRTWTIEFCFDQYDILPSDNLDPTESYFNELDYWLCETYKNWSGDTTCATSQLDILNDPYDSDTYFGTGGVVDSYMDMSGIVGPYWDYDVNIGPILTSNCPNCSCIDSCIPDGT